MRPAMKSTAPLFSALLAVSMLAGCSSYKPTPEAFHKVLDEPYRLGAGDRVRVTVFEQQGLTNTYSVDQSGYLSFPLIGAIPARGHTSQQLEGEIAKKLRQGYLRDPDVSVEIDRYRPIFVMGEVGAVGPVFLCSGPDRTEGRCDRRRLFASRQPGERRHHPRHQWQGTDRTGGDVRSVAARRHRLCPRTPVLTS